MGRETGDAWERAWNRVSEAGDRTAEAGDYALERTKEGTIRAYRKTERVAGEVGEMIEDAAVLTAVKTRLGADPDTRAMSIDVDVDAGVVTLSGNVSSAKEAAEAVRIAVDTHGASEVVSKLSWK